MSARGGGRATGRTPVTPRSTLFPYTTLFRSLGQGTGLRRRDVTGQDERRPARHPGVAVGLLNVRAGGRKSNRPNSRHTEIYTLSLHDAFPISRPGHGPASA